MFDGGSGMKTSMIVALALLASCTKKNPDLCCTTDEDCASVGLASGTGCSDGLSCIGHGCVAEQCNTGADCPTDQPVCRAGVCGVCDETVACSMAAPVCDLTNLTCGGCAANADCSAFAGDQVCDMSKGACVECTEASQCPVTKPFCNANACVSCTSHADCASNACLPDGSCGTDDNTAYVDAVSGTSNTVCSKAMPCNTISAGEATLKPNLRLKGQFAEDIAITDRDATILGDPGTSVTKPAGSPQLATVLFDGAATNKFYISGLVIKGGSFGFGISSAGSLTLDRVQISQVVGSAMIVQSVQMSNSVIANNGSGIESDVDCKITNSIIVGNGSATDDNSWGGLVVKGTCTIEYTTIADNRATGVLFQSGITCPNGGIEIGGDNIVSNNKISAACGLDYTLFDAGTLAVKHNKAGNPEFRNTVFTDPPAVDFYRIGPTSAAIDGGDPQSSAVPDIDGVVRPQGNGFDMGASEFKP